MFYTKNVQISSFQICIWFYRCLKAWRPLGWHLDGTWNTWTPKLFVFSCSGELIKFEATPVFDVKEQRPYS